MLLSISKYVPPPRNIGRPSGITSKLVSAVCAG
jgi:hypothetical protein